MKTYQIVRGKIANSGSDLVREVDSDVSASGYKSEKFIKIQHVKLLGVPSKLLNGNHSNSYVVAYDENQKVLAWYNENTKEVSSYSIINLVFHEYVVVVFFLLGYYFYDHRNDSLKLLMTFGVALFASALVWAFSYSKWRNKMNAQLAIEKMKQ